MPWLDQVPMITMMMTKMLIMCTRVFPSSSTSTAEDLLPLLKGDTYSDLLLAAWEKKFSPIREEGRQILAELCREGRHLIVPQTQ